MSSIRPMRDGSDFRNQMCATGLASSMWPMRSRRTLAWRHFDAALFADDAAVLHDACTCRTDIRSPSPGRRSWRRTGRRAPA
jgi:hypothetical protein